MRSQAIPMLRRAALLVGALVACSEPPPGGEPIDREIFIETYVDLRLAAFARDDFVVTPEDRAEILGRHGVDEERLLHFADVHGPDTEFMNEVWAEVERRLRERRESEEASAWPGLRPGGARRFSFPRET